MHRHSKSPPSFELEDPNLPYYGKRQRFKHKFKSLMSKFKTEPSGSNLPEQVTVCVNEVPEKIETPSEKEARLLKERLLFLANSHSLANYPQYSPVRNYPAPQQNVSSRPDPFNKYPLSYFPMNSFDVIGDSNKTYPKGFEYLSVRGRHVSTELTPVDSVTNKDDSYVRTSTRLKKRFHRCLPPAGRLNAIIYCLHKPVFSTEAFPYHKNPPVEIKSCFKNFERRSKPKKVVFKKTCTTTNLYKEDAIYKTQPIELCPMKPEKKVSSKRVRFADPLEEEIPMGEEVPMEEEVVSPAIGKKALDMVCSSAMVSANVVSNTFGTISAFSAATAIATADIAGPMASVFASTVANFAMNTFKAKSKVQIEKIEDVVVEDFEIKEVVVEEDLEIKDLDAEIIPLGGYEGEGEPPFMSEILEDPPTEISLYTISEIFEFYKFPDIPDTASSAEDLDIPSSAEALEIIPTVEVLEIIPTAEVLEIIPTVEVLEITPTAEALDTIPTAEPLDIPPTEEALDIPPTVEELDIPLEAAIEVATEAKPSAPMFFGLFEKAPTLKQFKLTKVNKAEDTLSCGKLGINLAQPIYRAGSELGKDIDDFILQCQKMMEEDVVTKSPTTPGTKKTEDVSPEIRDASTEVDVISLAAPAAQTCPAVESSANITTQPTIGSPISTSTLESEVLPEIVVLSLVGEPNSFSPLTLVNVDPVSSVDPEKREMESGEQIAPTVMKTVTLFFTGWMATPLAPVEH